MNSSFNESLQRMNRIKAQSHLLYSTLSILRAAAVATLVTAIWNDVAPANQLLHFMTGIVTFIAIIRFSSLSRSYKINSSSLLLSLDMAYPNTNQSPFLASVQELPSDEWIPRLQREERRLRAWEWRRLTTLSGSLLVPTLAASLLLSKAPVNLANVWTDAKNVISALTGGVTLEVLDGIVPNGKKTQSLPLSFSLSTTTVKSIELIPGNLLKLTIVRVESSTVPPIILLQSVDHSAPLSIQMSPAGNSNQSGNIWTAEFSASESSDLIVPIISNTRIATLKILDLPNPKVKLSLEVENKDPWPDQELLPLTIHATSIHPLDKVLLKIKSGKKTSEESVLTISGSTTSVSTVYKLNLLPWMEDDIVEFDIIAEAIDHGDPAPLTGKSNPIHIKVASAYGRYKNTLETLKDVKSSLDEARTTGKPVSSNAGLQLKKALFQSEDTPYFDGTDRIQLEKITRDFAQLPQNYDVSKIQNISDELGNFLLEHETLDDRERDRDFFIAIRSFSRLIDLDSKSKLNDLHYVSSKMMLFLDERHKRWAVRVNRLGQDFEPSSWVKISKERPFHSALKLATKNAESNIKISQGNLSALAAEYRQWIEELEAKEDQARAKQEQERQQGLANARNELREIQQRQDQISSSIDRASEHNSKDLASKWPSARSNENSNIKQSKSLLAKLRAMSPSAGERLEAAIEAMDLTLAHGEQEKWAEAETHSDLAGRLLRDADQAASRSQKQKDRGRRKKTGGDDFHGTAIGGQIDIKSEYKVDPKYREEILHDVEDELSTGENKNTLDSWLRQVVR